MGERGPKGKFNDRLKETFIRLAGEGKTLEQIAEVVGVSSRTLNNWMGKHQDLLLAVREARQMADELVEASLFSRALGYSHPEEKVFLHRELGVVTHPTVKHYPPDTQAAMFWLRNRQPERWKEKNEGDVNVQNNNFGALTDEQLDARISAMLAKAAPAGGSEPEGQA